MTPGTTRTVIAEVPSGKVELVLLAQELMVLQFNAKCSDVIHLCKAACCRMRSTYNVALEADEISKFKNIQHPAHPGHAQLRVIQPSDDGHTCGYLSADNACGVQEDKPKHCRVWHCSPGGQNHDGSRAKFTALGWALLPFSGEIPAEVVVESLLASGNYVSK